MSQPTRFPWGDFPDVFIHASESLVKRHRAYASAKSGDVSAAAELVFDTLSPVVLDRMWDFFGGRAPTLVSAHAEEAAGMNAIPEAMANAISAFLKWQLDSSIFQANKVNHTGANGYARLQRQAIFSGVASLGLNYVLVDDFIGQGGTLANLRGHILAQGGHVLGATALTGKDYSAKLAPTDLQTAALRRQHGHIEDWWRQRFGFGFNCLTASETRYLCRTSTSERIIERLEEVAG